MQAFFDESGHIDQPGYYAVAGFIGSDYQWQELERLWRDALAAFGAPYMHMREFAHSKGPFTGWEKGPREGLMAAVVAALKESRLTAVGCAMRVADFKALTEDQQSRMVSPYFCCLQDVMFGFAMTSQEAPAGLTLQVIGDQGTEYEAIAHKLWTVLPELGVPYDRLAPKLEYRNMRDNPGLQAADVLAYEMTKELASQDGRPDAAMRWPLDQLLRDQAEREIMMLVFRNREYLLGQADGHIGTRVGEAIVETHLDEMMRIYRIPKG